jgi:hypothetical protein
VKKNREDLDALLLTTEFIDYNFERHNKLIEFIKAGHFSRSSVKNFFDDVSKKDKVMLSKMKSAWRIGRKAEDPGNIFEDYLWAFNIAATYSEYLSNNPDEFIKIIKGNSL